MSHCSAASTYATIEAVGIVPVIRAATAEQAIEACRAVVHGGAPVLEVTLTVPGALGVMEHLRRDWGERVVVGAGTVLTAQDAQDCIAAGAEFIVTPGFNPRVIEACHAASIAITPGALTPTEVISAWQAGCGCVKVFPCSALGGAKYLRSLRGPLPEVKLMPTGGVNLKTAPAYIAAGAVCLGIGSELVDGISLGAGRYDIIAERARDYVRVVRDARRMLHRDDAAE
jgi:2-dehydro-3-deoxyphosphogluconate aldolase/(4S)-4-hydroxy-2-oxoglutarate aldolase